jgi:hypothetical protein
MKKTIIGSLLLAALLVGVPVGATTCLCVGKSNTKICGGGAVGGSFLNVKTVSDNNIKYFLPTTILQAQLNASGKAYDPQSGWFCWNGTLQ